MGEGEKMVFRTTNMEYKIMWSKWIFSITMIFMFISFFGCGSFKYASMEKQNRIQKQMFKQLDDRRSKEEILQKKLFDALSTPIKMESPDSYSVNKIDKYFERVAERVNLNELDEVYTNEEEEQLIKYFNQSELDRIYKEIEETKK